jgi:CheY-like chemotaxis protein
MPCWRSGVLPNYGAAPTLAPILIVDDRWEDNFLLQRLFRVAQVANPVSAATSGQEAIQYLKIARIAPCLVCLDTKMPLHGGLDVLHWIREHDILRVTAVVILTGSSDPADAQRAYELQADSYLLKYPSSQTLGEIVALANLPPSLRGEFPRSIPAGVAVPRTRF